jgi:hypothetical protein
MKCRSRSSSAGVIAGRYLMFLSANSGFLPGSVTSAVIAGGQAAVTIVHVFVEASTDGNIVKSTPKITS